jgi:hypothetical protein
VVGRSGPSARDLEGDFAAASKSWSNGVVDIQPDGLRRFGIGSAHFDDWTATSDATLGTGFTSLGAGRPHRGCKRRAMRGISENKVISTDYTQSAVP